MATLLVASGLAAALFGAPTAGAHSQCTIVAAGTTRYSNPGNVQISRSPTQVDPYTPYGVCEPYYLCDRDGISWDFSRDRD